MAHFLWRIMFFFLVLLRLPELPELPVWTSGPPVVTSVTQCVVMVVHFLPQDLPSRPFGGGGLQGGRIFTSIYVYMHRQMLRPPAIKDHFEVFRQEVTKHGHILGMQNSARVHIIQLLNST